MTAPYSISRRGFMRLTAAGGLLPFLASHARTSRAAGAPKTRLVLLMQSNGTSQSNFWPAANQTTSPILEPILSQPRLRDRTTLVRGLFNHGGGAGNGHDQGFAGLHSGYRPVGTFDDPWGNGPSIDQILRRQLTFGVPFPTLNCGVLASDTPRLKDHRASFSYIAAHQQVPTAVDPVRLHHQLFASTQDHVFASKRLQEDRSVLDYAATDLASIRGRLGAAEREKLDVHATSVRDLEQRLALLQSRPAPTGQCANVAPPSALAQIEANVPTLMDTMLDLGAVALGCGLVQILTFQFGNSGEKWRFDWLGIHRNSHDDIAHRDDGKDPEITALLVQINRWYAQRVARFAAALDTIPEGDGTVLDNTLIVWANELATGKHGLDDIPIALIGGASGQLRRGFRVVDQGPKTYHTLGCSLLGLMGAPAPGLGEEANCGPVQGL
jgi:hypothetical protein